MTTFVIIVLSVVQGLAEFLPISSSAHLLLVPWLFNWADPGLGFDAAIHLGTALALIVYFWKDFWNLLVKKNKLLWYIVVASIPGATIGFLGDKWITEHLHDASNAPLIVGVGMILFSLILLYADNKATQKEVIKQLSLKQSLVIGLAQVLALVPGVSRAGVTITAGLFTGLKREDAARFSFLLATPITVGAGAYKFYELFKAPPGTISNSQLILGVLISAIVGVAVIKWLLNYLGKHNLRLFVIYRALLGATVILIWLLRLRS